MPEAVATAPPAPDFDAQTKDAVTAYKAQNADIAARQAAERAPRAASVAATASDIASIEATPVKSVPLPQNMAQHLDPKALNEAASIWMTLGALGGLLTRQPMTAALGNMTAAMKGVHAGDAEQYDRAIGEFKTNFDAAMRTNKAMIDERDKIIRDKSLSLTAMSHALRQVDVKYGNETGRSKSDFMSQMKMIDSMRKTHEQAVRAGEVAMKAAAKVEAARAKHAAAPTGGTASGSNIQAEGAMLATGMPINQVIPGGRYNFAHQNEVKAEAIRQIKEATGMSDEQAGAEYANRQSSYMASKQSVVQLTKMLGATRQAVDQLDFNVKKAKEEMEKLPSSDLSPIINAIARGAEKWTGEPAYSSLFFYMSAVGMESARLLSGGQASIAQLHQGAQEEARKWASINMTPASFDAVANAMQQEGSERIKTFERAIEKQRIGGGGAPAAKVLPQKNAKGWTLHTDKNGNKAYVGPNNEIEEVK